MNSREWERTAEDRDRWRRPFDSAEQTKWYGPCPMREQGGRGRTLDMITGCAYLQCRQQLLNISTTLYDEIPVLSICKYNVTHVMIVVINKHSASVCVQTALVCQKILYPKIFTPFGEYFPGNPCSATFPMGRFISKEILNMFPASNFVFYMVYFPLFLQRLYSGFIICKPESK